MKENWSRFHHDLENGILLFAEYFDRPPGKKFSATTPASRVLEALSWIDAVPGRREVLDQNIKKLNNGDLEGISFTLTLQPRGQ